MLLRFFYKLIERRKIMKIRHLAATATASIALAAGVAAPSVAASAPFSGHWSYMACGVKGEAVYHAEYGNDVWTQSRGNCWKASAHTATGARVAVITGSYVPRHRIACTLFHNGRVVRHQVRTARRGHPVTVTCAARA